MLYSRLCLSLIAALLVGHGLMAEDRKNARTAPMGEGRGLPAGRSPKADPPQLSRSGASSRLPRGHQTRPVDAEIAVPRYFPRCTVLPNLAFWQQRDIFAEIQWMSRQGFIPVIAVDETVNELSGVADFPSGFKAYGFRVPAKGKLEVRLHHVNEGWFRVAMVNKWGDLGPGMLKNLIPTGNPEVRYTNPSKEAQAVYVIVDDPGWMSSTAYPYTLSVQRSWEPGQAETQGVKLVEGIWASNPLNSISAEFARPHLRAGFGVGMRW